MKRIACPLFLTALLFSACANHEAAPAAPAKPSSTPAAPADTAKKPADAPKPPPEPAKPTEMTAKQPAQPPKPAETAKPTETPAKAASDMDAAITALMAKPEQPDESIQVQHILIAFQGSLPGVTRSKEEAKALAEKIYGEVMAGGNFDELVKKYTNDSAPGIYPMTKAGRAGMVKAFGDVGFRLKVGEIGVAPFEKKASPYGWHIIKRLK